MNKIFSPNLFVSLNPKKFGRKRWNWKLFWKIFGIFCGICILGVFGVFAYFYKDLPSPESLNERFVIESTKIYDRTGNHLLYEVHGEEKRTQIAYSEMPDVVKYATIALEDREFYSHHGIKFSAILRAVFKDIIKLGSAQGGSTITQQLIKKSMLSDEKTLTRKIKEVILSFELEQKFSKDEILEMYLNTIPYGSNAYGIEAASQTFFGKHARELSLDEAALLASLPQAPSFYSPYGSHTDRLKWRQEFALKTMAELGYITKEQYEEAKNVDIFSKINPFRETISAPHFVMYIKEYLEKKYGEQTVEQGGLRVYTTLDWDKQQIAERVVREGAEKNKEKYSGYNAALVAADPKTGQILSMVGSKNFFGKSEPDGCKTGKTCKFEPQVNATISLLQPGSSFKPYVYLTAFIKGYTPDTNIWDVDTNFSTDEGKEYNPKNYDGKNSGLIKMKDALARSLNVPAVKTLYLTGIKDSIDTARRMGITSLNDGADYGLSLVLGGAEVRLVDHVNAFGTFATGGIRHDKTIILRIEDNNGNILEKYESNPGERVIEEKYIAMIDYILSTNELRAPVFGEKNPLSFENRKVAAKTGTTNEWRDGWTMGYTPSLVAGVWAGNNDHTIMAQGADGVLVAAPIWRAFMDEALKNYTTEDFPKYEPEETKKDVLDGKLLMKEELKVCKIPGEDDEYCLANDACPDSKKEKKKFSNAHSILHYIKKDDPREDSSENSKDDPQYDNWEKAVKKWLKDNKYSTSEPPTDECDEDDFKKYEPEVEIKSPSNGSKITSPSFTVSVKANAPYGVDKMTIYVNGSNICSDDNDKMNCNYTVPDDKKHSDIKIKVDLRDENENSASDEIEIETDIP